MRLSAEATLIGGWTELFPCAVVFTTGHGRSRLLMGYRDTRDVITLYERGTGGLEELHQYLTDEVLYGFARVDNYTVLITYMSDQVR